MDAAKLAQLDELHALIDCIHSPGCRLEMDDYLVEVDEDSLGSAARTLLDFMLFHKDMRRSFAELIQDVRNLTNKV